MNNNSLLFLVNVLGYGGAELQVVQLAIGMKRRGWDVTVVTLVPPAGLVDQLREHGVEVLCLNMRPGIPDPMAIARLRKIIKARGPRVVHSHIVHANLLARAARLLSRMPVLVCTAHSVKEGSRFLELGYRLTDRLADLTTNVSQAGVDRYVRIGAAPADRIRFVPNGLDLGRFVPNDRERLRVRREEGVEDRFVWLAVGRFTLAKDYPNLLRAFAAIVEKTNATNATRVPSSPHEPDQPAADPVLLLAGRGSLEAEVRALVESLGLGERVRILGLRNDIPALMNGADAYVLSSAWEGMPQVLQEASATGLPIVATDVGGTGEVVLDGRSGLLVPPKDSAALAGAMRRLMSLSAADRRRMGCAGREHVESRYGIERVLDTWEAIYHELSRAKVGSHSRDACIPPVTPAPAAGAGKVA